MKNKEHRQATVFTGVLCVFLSLAFVAWAGFPDPVPVPGQRIGADQVVNTTLAGSQKRHAIALAPDGGLIAVWDEATGGVRGRLFDRSGTPVGDDFLVSDSGIRPKVAALESGFVVIVDNINHVSFVLLEADGGQIGGEGVNVNAASNTTNPDIARLADGSFVVVWEASSSPHDNDGFSIRARALTSAGLPVGDEIGVNLVTAGRQDFPRVSASNAGGFLVVWQSGQEVRSRRFATLGGASGGDILVATPVASSPRPAVTGTLGGEYWVAWEDSVPVDQIKLHRVDASGSPYGAIESLVGTLNAHAPSITTGRYGDGMVAWSADEKIFAQRISPGGSPVGQEFRVDVLGTYAERRGAWIAADAEGGFFATWYDFDCCAGVAASRGNAVGDVWLKRYPPLTGDFTDGLVAHWSFDDNTANEGFGDVEDNGTVNNAEAINFGRFGGGVRFNNSANAQQKGGPSPGVDWISFEASSDLEVSGNEVTIACWIRLTNEPSTFPEEKASIWDGVIDNYVLFVDRNDASIRFVVTNQAGQSTSVRIPEERIKLFGWQQITAVYDGNAGQMRIYFDGILVDTAPLTGNIRSSLSQLPAIGRNGSGNTVNDERYYFLGNIDDMAIWNRALSEVEIESLAQQKILVDSFESPDL